MQPTLTDQHIHTHTLDPSTHVNNSSGNNDDAFRTKDIIIRNIIKIKTEQM